MSSISLSASGNDSLAIFAGSSCLLSSFSWNSSTSLSEFFRTIYQKVNQHNLSGKLWEYEIIVRSRYGTFMTDSILQAGSTSTEASLLSFWIEGGDDFWGLVYISWILVSPLSSDSERKLEAGHKLLVLCPGGDKGGRGEILGILWV